MMKKLLLVSGAAVLLFYAPAANAQEPKKMTVQDSIALAQTLKGENELKKNGGDRNVLLNAENNTGPRNVNIGLPGNVGGITILENDLPVVYFFWPEMPVKTWRSGTGLERIGLLPMDKLANSMGDLGFAVASSSQVGTKQLKIKGKLSTNHYGWLQGDLNISGPITKNGWTYSANVYQNYDPGTFDMGFTQYNDKTTIYRAGITKYFSNDKGQFSIFYKYANSITMGNTSIFEYGPNGKVKELDYFKIGRDSYIVRDGQARFLDAITGNYYTTDLDGKKGQTPTHTVDAFGNYKLENGWNFKYTTRLHLAKASILVSSPISFKNVAAADGYTYADSGEAYTGTMSGQLNQNAPRIETSAIMGRFSLAKKIKDHDLTFGILEQFYKVNDFQSNRSFSYQSAEAQPRRLIGPDTDSFGYYNYNAGAEYYDGSENKISVYGSDDWTVNENLKINYGLHLRYQSMQGDRYLTSRPPGTVFNPADKVGFKNDWFQKAGTLNATYNIVKNMGVLANLLYTEENGPMENYATSAEPNWTTSKSPMGAMGIFWNTKYFQLVSHVNYLTKNRYLKRFNLVNPVDPTQTENATVYYNIQTVGWTTDIAAKPFKGFDLHYLVTFQNPVYKKFNFSAFGTNYDYSDNNVLEISKVLMEIDPSYSVDKWRFWASFRYFSKQYASLTNALYFQGRWETFGGINYSYNKNISIGATFINFLNQRGAKGAINGSELLTDASQYYGRILSGSYIMPFTAQLSLSFNF